MVKNGLNVTDANGTEFSWQKLGDNKGTDEDNTKADKLKKYGDKV